MSLISLMIYGSRARGDYQASSDIDLFGLSQNLPSHLISQERIKLNIYNHETFSKMAGDGSLYVWHLKSEGIIILDQDNILRSSLDSFSLKHDYSKERQEAATIGWLLFSPEVNKAQSELIIATVIYVIRTIAYSLLAEQSIPAFSLKKVLQYIPDEKLQYLWHIKNNATLSPIELAVFEKFLKQYTGEPPGWQGSPLLGLAVDGFSSFARRRHKELIESALSDKANESSDLRREDERYNLEYHMLDD